MLEEGNLKTRMAFTRVTTQRYSIERNVNTRIAFTTQRYSIEGNFKTRKAFRRGPDERYSMQGKLKTRGKFEGQVGLYKGLK